MAYADYLPLITPPGLAGVDGKVFARTVGQQLDAVRARVTEATKARFPTYAPDDALDEIGKDRQLPRADGEGAAAYRARLKAAFETWAGDDTPLTGKGGPAGSPIGLLKQLRVHGFPHGATGARIVTHQGRWVYIDGSDNPTFGAAGECVNRQNLLGAVPGDLVGFTLDARDQFYSRFIILFPADVTGLENTAGNVKKARLNYLAWKWRQGGAHYDGAVVLVSGKVWGWPIAGNTWGAASTDWGTAGVSRFIEPR